MRVHKFKVDDNVNLPLGYKILSCQELDHTIFVWALVDPHETQTVTVQFKIIGTGRDIDAEQWTHLATLIDDNLFVWHVFIDENS
jgi:hypothetical protein